MKNKKLKKYECEHDWQATAYFYGAGDKDEWLVLTCFDCEARKVIRGTNQRNEMVNTEIL